MSHLYIAPVDSLGLFNPPIFGPGSYDRNWLARIWHQKSNGYGGIGRDFAKPAHEPCESRHYIIPDTWTVGTPVEFGADLYDDTTGSFKRWQRWYGIIVRIGYDRIVFRRYENEKRAIQAGRKCAESDRVFLTDYLDDLNETVETCDRGSMQGKMVQAMVDEVRAEQPDQFMEWLIRKKGQNETQE